MLSGVQPFQKGPFGSNVSEKVAGVSDCSGSDKKALEAAPKAVEAVQKEPEEQGAEKELE